MAIIELFFTCFDWAENVLPSKVVSHVGLHVLLLPKLFRAARVRAFEELSGDWLPVSSLEQLAGIVVGF